MAPPTACDLNGNYRLRFRAKGANGWWLKFSVEHDKLHVISDSQVLGLETTTPAVTLDTKACTITLGATTKTGTVKIALTVAGAHVAGTVARTDDQEKIAPIDGLRQTSPQEYPACIHPGLYEIHVANVKKWKLTGSPRIGNCKEMSDKTVFVRLDLLGNELVIDEARDDEPHPQFFGRATVRWLSGCEIMFSLDVQDFRLHEAHTFLEDDGIHGTTSDFTYDFMENSDSGENLWSCHTNQGDVVWKRISG